MGHVYRERAEMPIPAGAHINHADGRVFVYYPANSKKRKTIGHATSETMMHPNDTCRILFPDLWREAYDKKYHDPDEPLVRAGLYALCLGASAKNGLYSILLEAYGPQTANMIMDLSMYLIVSGQEETEETYPERMKSEVLFSDRVYGAYLGLFFSEHANQEMHDIFKRGWLERWIARGGKKVWLWLDGSARNGSLADQNEDRIETIHAVDAGTGEPVTYAAGEGEETDFRSALQKIIRFLTAAGAEVEGIILDGDQCTEERMQNIRELHLDYVIRVREPERISTLTEKMERDFAWNFRYLIDEVKGVYGIAEEEKNRDMPETMNLYFDATRESDKGIELLKAFSAAKQQAEEIGLAGAMPGFSENLHPFFEHTSENEHSFRVRNDLLKKVLLSQGYFALRSSRNFGPQKTYEIYRLRRPSDNACRLTSARTGLSASRDMPCVRAICFASGILFDTILSAAILESVEMDELLWQTENVLLVQRGFGDYVFAGKVPADLLKVIRAFGIELSMFNRFALEYGHRLTTSDASQVHMLQPQQNTEPKKTVRRGRKPGSRNRKTLEREANEANTAPKLPKKRGRPEGTRDRSPRKKRSDAGTPRGPYGKRKADDEVK